MDIVKEIINCETNTKFVRVHDDGLVDIPDVIFYVLYERGDTDVIGCCIGEEYPHIAEEVANKDYCLNGCLYMELIDQYFNYLDVGYERALVDIKAFVKEAKKSLPLLRIDTGVDEWMKEH